MGRAIAALAAKTEDLAVVAGVDPSAKGAFDFPVYPSFDGCEVAADVVVDFSNPAALPALVDFCLARSLPVVVATTGLEESHRQRLAEASARIPVFLSANMSLGVNLLLDLAAKAAAVLYPEFDVELVEAHHNQKLDAPSGTALMIADRVNETLDRKLHYVYERKSVHAKREKTELGIHSIRGGTIVGEHTLVFAGPDETVEIKHTALSREVFAHGALKAARYLAGKAPGLYAMKDVIASA